jgi:TonB family protein
LKQQAARLQAQLGSLLFTETHPASAVPGGPTASKPSADESKTAAPERKNGSGILSADEDVKIPSWLAPLSQNAEAVVSDSPEKEISQDGSTLTGETTHAVEADATSDAKGAVIGGQLLGESASESSTSGSKKGLLIGVAATLLIGGGVWYFATNHSASTPNTAERVNSSPSTTSSAPAVSSSPVASASTTTTNKATSSSTPASQPVKKAAPTSSAAAPVSETPSGNSTAADSTPENVAPSRPKPALGKVHLAAPVVSHSSDSETDAPALPSVDADTSVAGDPLAAAAAKHNAPNAPLPVGGDVKQARLIRSVPPQYPAIAKAQRLSGKVEIDALVDKNGNVANTKVISGPPLLYGAAVDAVKQWKYSPALLDGEPTAMHLTVTVEFRAQ